MSGFAITNTTVDESVNTVLSLQNQSQTLSGAGVINLSVPLTNVVQTGTAYTVTLPNPQYIGQLKTVMVGSFSNSGYSPITISFNWSYYADPSNVTTYNIEYLGDNLVFIGTSIGWSYYNYVY